MAETNKQLSGTVLAVDDNEINHFIIKKTLTKWGLKVDIAENGQEAIDKLSVGHYDLVLMDIHMPVMDGRQATEIIRSLNNGQYKDLPIIALTATVITQDIEDILKSGMNDYITKPFVIEELFLKLTTILNK